jgi:hypothetical protein
MQAGTTDWRTAAPWSRPMACHMMFAAQTLPPFSGYCGGGYTDNVKNTHDSMFHLFSGLAFILLLGAMLAKVKTTTKR